MALPTPAPSTHTKHACTKVTGVSAVADVASAICDIAAQFGNADAADTDLLTTPQHRTAAICAVAINKDLTYEEHIQVIYLFQCDISVADTYLAIDDVDLCTEFIHAEIDM